MKTLIVAFLILLSGCAMQPQPVHPMVEWSRVNKPLAEQGKIKWSDYYKGLYQQGLTLQSPIQPAFLEQVNNLIKRAQEYESGQITKDQFDGYRRDYQVTMAKAYQAAAVQTHQQQALDAQTSAAQMGAAAQLLQAGQPRPATTATQCQTFFMKGMAQTNCQ